MHDLFVPRMLSSHLLDGRFEDQALRNVSEIGDFNSQEWLVLLPDFVKVSLLLTLSAVWHYRGRNEKQSATVIQRSPWGLT